MICDECKKKEATYHEIKKINGVATERHLCAECQLKQAKSGSGIDIAGMFSGFKTMLEPKRQNAGLRCSKCGTTSEEFLNSAYVGCAECYKELKSVVNSVVQRVQAAPRHTGKSPFPQTAEGKEREYECLQSALEEAINRNDMAEAEAIFAKIRSLKNG